MNLSPIIHLSEEDGRAMLRTALSAESMHWGQTEFNRNATSYSTQVTVRAKFYLPLDASSAGLECVGYSAYVDEAFHGFINGKFKAAERLAREHCIRLANERRVARAKSLGVDLTPKLSDFMIKEAQDALLYIQTPMPWPPTPPALMWDWGGSKRSRYSEYYSISKAEWSKAPSPPPSAKVLFPWFCNLAIALACAAEAYPDTIVRGSLLELDTIIRKSAEDVKPDDAVEIRGASIWEEIALTRDSEGDN